ncbi:MAG: hypothetical protein N2490_09235 [Ignavibacteria bacterium]|nr:hypothetical protein [Ignavibacteria bacterium]
MKRKLIFIVILLFALTSTARIQAQVDIDSTEIQWTVPELFDFHEVIYQIWHEAYPAKDVEKLKSFVPEIKAHIEKINNAKLPGIVKDKEAKWKEGLQKLNNTAEEYYKATEISDPQVLLDAAEKLHADFEMMVRIIKPLTKEIDEYHKVLYVIYHKIIPENRLTELEPLIDELITRGEAILNAKLPKKIESKKDEFLAAVKELIDATKAVKSTIQSTDDPTKIKDAVEVMHTKYQKLENLFD